MAKLILCAVAMGGILILLCACANRAEQALTPEGDELPATTIAPTRVPDLAPLPGPTLPVKPAGGAPTHTLTLTDTNPQAADLEIQAVHDGAGAYTLTVRNLGPNAATGIVLTDILSEGVTPLWVEPAQPVCGRQEREVGCDLGTLQPGDATTITLDLTVSGSEAPTTSTQLAGVTVIHPVPACALDLDPRPPRVTCRLDTLQPGAEAQARVGVEVGAGTSGQLVHTASVRGNEIDPDDSNNTGTFPITAGALGPAEAAAVPTAPDLTIQADGPGTVVVSQPFTYTYTIRNQGTSKATDVWFEDVVPSDLDLVAYAPGPPHCEQQGDRFTCTLSEPGSIAPLTFTLVITGHGGQAMQMSVDPLQPGWPICWVIKERTWLHIVQCQLGELAPRQGTKVQLVFVAIGVTDRTTTNTASVRAYDVTASPIGLTSTVTITIQAGAEPSRP